MKKIIIFFSAILCATGLHAQNEVQCAFTSIDEDITSTTTLSSGTLYRLEGCIHVTAGDTLFIQAGTKIMGEKASKATLIIDPGAVLISQGTAMNPVVFTSDQEDGHRNPGDWGGIIVLGLAKNNTGGQITLTSKRTCPVTGGGSNNNDNSGVFKYMRIEYPIFGLSMVCVGNATEFHDVQVSEVEENALELYGGTVNFKRFVSLNAHRSDILATHGNLSKAQYLLGLRLDPLAYVTTDELSNGIVFANNNDALNDYASAPGEADNNPVFSNVTLIGPGYCETEPINGNFKNGVLYYRNTSGSVWNTIISGWETGLRIEGTPALDNADVNYTLKFAQNTLYNNSFDYSHNAAWPANCATDMTEWMDGTSLAACRQPGNQFNPSVIGFSETICGDLCTTPPSFLIDDEAQGFDLELPDYSAAALSDNFFEEPDFRGAFDATTDWTAGWTKFCPLEEVYCTPAQRKDNPTGLNDKTLHSTASLSVTPNPVKGIAYAEFTAPTNGQVQIIITNAIGQVVRRMDIKAGEGKQRIELNTEGLEAGLYIVNMQQNGTRAHAKMIIR